MFPPIRFLLCLTATVIATSAAPMDIVGPSGSGAFGKAVTVLPNGSFVVTDPLYDLQSPAVVDAGAVYLFNSAGVLLSTLTGSTASDQVGSGGVKALSGGNFVILSPNWNGAASKTGAVTWASITTGISGTVSVSNSLTGGSANDQAGSSGIFILPNGNYLVCSAFWDGTAPDVGAVTWCNGSTGRTGLISVVNSLVGSTANDRAGSSGVTPLTNGNYVVNSPNWNSPASKAGASTWGNGASGVSGTISSANSLVGSSASDFVGASASALPNGNYVIRATGWDSTTTVNAGAVTWGNGTTGTIGVVSESNSLVGTASNMQVGGGGITVLANGNYVVGTYHWNSEAGAITWCSGTTGRIGLLTAAISLTGDSPGDHIGVSPGGVTALKDGNYVVFSLDWNNGTSIIDPGYVMGAGSATWCDGNTGRTGVVSAANSLIGATRGEGMGTSVIALSGGRFVVTSPGWEDNVNVPNTSNRGAVIFCTSGSSCVGTADTVNSLTGEGNTSNSRGANYQVGSGGITFLTNGNYVVKSPEWGRASFEAPIGVPWDCGAVTWGNGDTGVTGFVTPSNSVTGGTAYEKVGTVIPLTNGNFVISSYSWDAGSAADAGAIRWCNGVTAATTGGPISAINSLVGSTASDSVGSVTALSDGNYVVFSRYWDNVNLNLTDAGAITFGDGTGGPTGPINSGNSILGTVASGGPSMVFDYDPPRHQLIVGRPASNLVTLWLVPVQVNPNTIVLLPTYLGNGSLRINFTGTPGSSYTLVTSVDLATPMSTWPSLGVIPEISSGQFQFTSATSADPRRFFAVRLP